MSTQPGLLEHLHALRERVSKLEAVKRPRQRSRTDTLGSPPLESTDPTERASDPFGRRMFVHALAQGFRDTRFVRGPVNYYDLPLEARRALLGAPSVAHLCKSIVMENTRCTRLDCADRRNSKYYCIVIQYVRRLNGENVLRFLRALNEGRGIPRKNFNFQLARDAHALTGYDHNSVTPLAMKTPMPVILDAEIAKLRPPEFWLGGGDVSLKWRVSLDEFMRAFDPFVGNVTFDDEEPDDI